MLAADRFGPGGRDYRSWTTFASVTDGLSNTLLIGEKNISAVDLKDPSANAGDANFYYSDTGANTNNQKSSIRVIQHAKDTPWSSNGFNSLAATSANGPSAGAQPLQANMFGSWHTGVTMFAMADGGVKQIRTNADRGVLHTLACRTDGVSACVDDH
jgi:hypothetical protein